MAHSFLGVIPARFKSSRFPGKPLVNINGKPLVIHVCEKASEALGNEHFVVATEDERIIDVVEKFGFRGILTTDKPITGTDRLWEVAQQIKVDFYINIQGDEPLIKPKDILSVYNARLAEPEYITNGYCELLNSEDPFSLNIPKVIVNEKEELIYISRLPIPGIKGRNDKPNYLKQVCIYTFNYEELKKYGERKSKSFLESFEDIEILRFLEMGYKIKMVKTTGASLAIDIPEDVIAVENELKWKI
jgi:3-deoxy-manno-octulosonate cytidylyltransferase (CMP-KDO synthetase)